MAAKRAAKTKTTKVSAERKARTLDVWKGNVQSVADRLLPGLGDLWGTNDPYDLLAIAKDAFEARQIPQEFFEVAFEEELARAAYDEDQAAEALAYDEEEEEEEEEEESAEEG